MSYEGVLPPPNMLRAYNDVVPGAADRIIAMAERQAAHRQSLEKAVVDSNVAAEKRGQNYGLVIGLVMTVGAFILIGMGYAAFGIATLVTEITALVAIFVLGRKRQERERERKRIEAQRRDSTPFG